jgi:hypothetical protein
MATKSKNVTNNRKPERADAFRRIAERRTQHVLESLRLLGQCSNRRSYEYNDEQVAKIFREVRSALRSAEERFKNDKKNTRFRL